MDNAYTDRLPGLHVLAAPAVGAGRTARWLCSGDHGLVRVPSVPPSSDEVSGPVSDWAGWLLCSHTQLGAGATGWVACHCLLRSATMPRWMRTSLAILTGFSTQARPPVTKMATTVVRCAALCACEGPKRSCWGGAAASDDDVVRRVGCAEAAGTGETPAGSAGRREKRTGGGAMSDEQLAPSNPYVLQSHAICAAAELPLRHCAGASMAEPTQELRGGEGSTVAAGQIIGGAGLTMMQELHVREAALDAAIFGGDRQPYPIAPPLPPRQALVAQPLCLSASPSARPCCPVRPQTAEPQPCTAK